MNVSWLEQSASDVPPEDGWLSAWEASLLAAIRVPKRRADWRLGRWTAKHAVAAYLDLPSNHRTLSTIAIRPAASGAPEVSLDNSPADLSISLSHRAGLGACAVAPSSVILGCDLELIEPRSDAFVADYFTAEEQEMMRQAPEAERFRTSALLWSAKESVLKLLRTGLRLDTRCVAITLGDGPRSVAGEETGRAVDRSLTASMCAVDGWCSFLACVGKDQSFHGWWQERGGMVRTIVANPSVKPPRVLQVEAFARRLCRAPKS